MRKLTFNLVSTVKCPRFGGQFPDGYEAVGTYDVWDGKNQVMDSDGKPFTITIMGINHRNGVAVTDEAIQFDLVTKAEYEMAAIEKKKNPGPEKTYTARYEVDLDAVAKPGIIGNGE